MKRLLFLLIAINIINGLFAQTKLSVFLKSGNVAQFNITEIDSMKLSNDSIPSGGNDPSQQTVTGDVKNVTNTSAILTCYANILDNLSTDVKVGIIYSTNDTPNKSNGTQKTIAVSSIAKDGSYSISLSDLTPNTTYFYRSFVYQSGLWFYGSVKSFSTSGSSSTVSFSSYISNITCYSAKVNVQMLIDATLSKTLASYGVCFDTIPDPTKQNIVNSKDALGNYSTFLRALTGNTIYYYRPFAVLDGITYYGNTTSFQSMEDNVVTTGDMAEDGSVNSKLTISGGAYSSLQVGMCWSTSHEVPTINDEFNIADELDDNNCYMITPSAYGLIYYRSFVKIDGIVHYGDVKSTERIYHGNHDTKEYVDLGLPSGTLWATCNIGASKPEEYGDYFAWGETAPQNGIEYTWESYKWCNGTYDTQIKYSTSITYGCLDNKTELDPEDDTAYSSWGEDWRMPTYDQIQELCNTTYVTTSWTTLNGIYGRVFCSKVNGNSIFIPAAGYCLNGQTLSIGEYASFWTCSLFSGNSSYAYDLYFNENTIGTNSGSRRYYGRNVRPIYLISKENN